MNALAPFYKLFCFPAYICYKIIVRNNKEIKEDFDINRKYHASPNTGEYVSFCNMMQKLPEYRFILYNRMPVVLGAILNIILPKRRIYFNINNLQGGVQVIHGWSTIVYANKIGKNFKIHQNCTVGNNHNGIPTIGDNVEMFPGSVVAGNIIIGNNV